MELLFQIKNQTLTLLTRAKIVADSINYLTARFEFTQDWDGLHKVVRFTREKYIECALEGDTCSVPWEMHATEGKFIVTVVGLDEEKQVRATTNAVELEVEESGYRPSKGDPTLPTLGIDEIKLGQILTSEANTKAYMNSAKADAEKTASDLQDVKDLIVTIDDIKEEASVAEATVQEIRTIQADVREKGEQATRDASTASNKAQIATEQAGIASNEAVRASNSANQANESASLAGAEADSASDSAILASQSANSASVSAMSANNSATTATTKANEAIASANTAGKHADTAITKANETSASATLANTKASEATNSANNALASEKKANQSATNAALSEQKTAEALTQANRFIKQPHYVIKDGGKWYLEWEE